MARRYSNLNPQHRPHGARAILRWGVLDRLAGKRRGVVGEPAPRVEPDLSFIDAPDQVPRVTWIGHSSFLASFGTCHVLLDPVFSDRIASVIRRRCPPGLQPDRLPPLVAALVTHCHYDHLDRPS
ncbi:MAG: MBL fold metallo-hydrolase, partial [Acidobacteria bacterium]|nr:MBL fold metallo-hydrolase [Acidobacteriota bacterium]NIM62296.1 MBL fold metallo-hydrolase [Acidobacteriota bacterium]NIO58237.1 MBL fold metallo-hydrolase [Acidobacteriota bacterium]NIQ29266.1 MBL fold metallo-hydrolase [Acidobacteriota bacterium]NIQ83865.1 MBL fold metallo-hydrolase [Acidobacteriota bacterium]